MAALISFLFSLPIKAITIIMLLIFITTFGFLRFTNQFSIRYDTWYELTRDSMIKILHWNGIEL